MHHRCYCVPMRFPALFLQQFRVVSLCLHVPSVLITLPWMHMSVHTATHTEWLILILSALLCYQGPPGRPGLPGADGIRGPPGTILMLPVREVFFWVQYWFDHKWALYNSFPLYVVVPLCREFPEGTCGVSTRSTGTGHLATDPGTQLI